mgnify:CR=1 FL=1
MSKKTDITDTVILLFLPEEALTIKSSIATRTAIRHIPKIKSPIETKNKLSGTTANTRSHTAIQIPKNLFIKTLSFTCYERIILLSGIQKK